MTIIPSEQNEHAYPIIEEESTIVHGDDKYIIKKVTEKSVGQKTIKSISAIHKFYVDMINKQQPKVHDGSITFQKYMQMVFEGTGYTFDIVGNFKASEFQNLGNDNRLSLLQKGLDRFKAEMELSGTHVRFEKQVGNKSDFQFRYGHNIKTIDKTIDSSNLATVIHGTGAEGIEATYRSPKADIFGELDSPPVNDERFKTKESLLDEMKSRLQDTPEVSIRIDFADLRSAGYPYLVPNEGDNVFIIYEPMDDLLIDTRILEINETFDINLKPIKTDVTLANFRKTFAGTMFSNVQKQLGEIVTEDGIIRYDILDQAVKIATEALQSAQTELIFENGIIARDKNDPNKIVLFNSAGIGISEDGGNTFNTAMTGAGIVADVITAGVLRGLTLRGNEIYGGLIQGSRFLTSSEDYGETSIRNGTIRQSGNNGSTLISRGYIDCSNTDGSRKTIVAPSDIAVGKMNIEVISGSGQSQITNVDYLEVGRLRVLDEIIEPNRMALSATSNDTNFKNKVAELEKRIETLEQAK